MYECEIDFGALTVEKLIDFVFTEMVYRKIHQLEEEAAQAKQDEDYGRPWTRFRKRIEALDDEERWIYYAERALDLLDHDVMWKGVVEACKILKYPEPSAIHTQQKTHNLFWPDENSIEQRCAAHIVQGCQQHCSTLLHLIAG